MRGLPGKTSEKGRVFSVGDFLEAAQERLRLTLIEGGESLGRKIDEPIVSRPGLALTGFFGHYGWRRIQLIGKAETAYLESLSPAERLSRFAALLEHGAYCFIFANGRKPGADTLALMRVHGAVVMVSPLKTRVIYRESAFVLERLGAPESTIYGTMVEVAGLGVLIGHAGEKMACIGAGGFIIQPMPDATDETIDKLEANLRKVNSVSHMVEHGLDAKGIIEELLQGFAVDYLTTTDLAFRCQCSKERISEVLLSLGKPDLESLIEDGHAEVCCHFCNERYEFSKEELQAIYDKAMAQRQQADS